MYLWSFIGLLAACGMEWLFLRSTSYWTYFPLTLVGAVNCTIYQLVQGAGSLLTAVVVFSGTNALLRLVFTLCGHREVSPTTWRAFGLICAANLIRLL